MGVLDKMQKDNNDDEHGAFSMEWKSLIQCTLPKLFRTSIVQSVLTQLEISDYYSFTE